jgi:hypothetical protein
MRACAQSPFSDRKDLETAIDTLRSHYGSMHGRSSYRNVVTLAEGEVAGDYSDAWTTTFDLVFVLLMLVGLAGLCVWTQLTHPELWHRQWFWLEQLPKLVVMMSVSLVGGLMCRYFCSIDEKGYIITTSSDVFKVNYTRKLQHFAAYLIPLLMRSEAASDIQGSNAGAGTGERCSTAQLLAHTLALTMIHVALRVLQAR